MKVILLQDIARVGRKNDVREVPDGHAHNYLIPRKLAIVATAENLKWQKNQQARATETAVKEARAFAEFLAQAVETPLLLTAPANAHGHLFKGLRAADIARAISARAAFPLAASAVALDVPIKTVGEHRVAVTVGAQRGDISVLVHAQ